MDGFVDVRVEATGQVERVPAEWVGHEVLGRGITLLEDAASAPAISAEPAVVAPVDVQLVAGDESDLPTSPAAVEAVLAARAAEAEARDAEPPTEKSTHDQIDAYAAAHGIDLAGASTKAEKLDVIADHPDPGDTESSTETPATGDEEN